MKKDIWALIVIILVIIAGGVYYWMQPDKIVNKSNSDISTVEAQAVLEKLQRHIILPVDEVPKIVQIDDPIQAVQTQPFLAGVQKGDLLIVYVKAQKAIVYSPSRDIIVNVGPISVTPEASVDQPIAPISASTTVTD